MRETISTNVLDLLAFEDAYKPLPDDGYVLRNVLFCFPLSTWLYTIFKWHFFFTILNEKLLFLCLSYCDNVKRVLNASWTQRKPVISGKKNLLSPGPEFHRIQTLLHITVAACSIKIFRFLLFCHRQFSLYLLSWVLVF